MLLGWKEHKPEVTGPTVQGDVLLVLAFRNHCEPRKLKAHLVSLKITKNPNSKSLL